MKGVGYRRMGCIAHNRALVRSIESGATCEIHAFIGGKIANQTILGRIHCLL